LFIGEIWPIFEGTMYAVYPPKAPEGGMPIWPTEF
jgi:hypothetical protein